MKISGNTILVTGGSSGIGLELAKQFLALGNTVAITGRNQEKLNQVKKDHPGLHIYKSDVTNTEDIKTLFQQVTTDFSTLNIIINNAGIMKAGNFYDPNEALNSVTEEILINLNGPVWMSHQFIPHLKKQTEAAIINVTSLLGIVPLPLSPVYSATKSGLRTFTTALREQLRHTNIKVYDLAPPATETELVEMFDKETLKSFKLMSAKDLAESAIKGIREDCFDIRPGQTNQVYYINKFAPGYLLKMMRKSLDAVIG